MASNVQTETIIYNNPAIVTAPSSVVVDTNMRLTDLRPQGALSFNDFEDANRPIGFTGKDLRWGEGNRAIANANLTGTLNGTAIIDSGAFKNSDPGVGLSYITYECDSNFQIGQSFAFACTYVTRYNSTPASFQVIFELSKNFTTLENAVFFAHASGTGRLLFQVFDDTGVQQNVGNDNLGQWLVANNTEYKILVYGTFDDTVPANTNVTCVIRDVNDNIVFNGSIGNFTYTVGDLNDLVTGSNIPSLTARQDFELNDFVLYNEEVTIFPDVQSIALTPYTPGESLIEIVANYFLDGLFAFTETSTNIQDASITYTQKIETSNLYWDGNAWVTSDKTLAQSNNVSEVNNNILSITDVRSRYKFFIILYSETGHSTAILDQNTFDYQEAPSTEDSIDLCTVYWFSLEPDGDTCESEFTAQLNRDAVKYKLQTLLCNTVTADKPDPEDGYTRVNLMPNSDMEVPNSPLTELFYTIFKDDSPVYNIVVPNQVSAILWDILQ